MFYFSYIKNHCRGRYITLLTEGKLNARLHEIDLEANEMFDSIISHIAVERGIDESLKVRDMLRLGCRDEQHQSKHRIGCFARGDLRMRSILQELWHGNISPQTDSRNNSSEIKQLAEYMVWHHDDLLKTMTDEQKEIFEKFDDCWSEYASYAEEAIFTDAFKIGAQLMIETQLQLNKEG